MNNLIKKYDSKYENYDISQRLDDLKDVVEIQCDPANANADEYMRGMANGLLLAWSIIREPYGSNVNYISRIAKGGENAEGK